MLENMWSFKHEPLTFDGVILSKDIKPKLKKIIKELPNILLYGTPGIGKGTYTKILLKESGCDYLWINASDETGIDTIRDKVRSFATSMGITPLKIVVLNEADSLSSGQQGAQKILRQLMEDVHKITRFIFLANYEQYIIPEIKSRCQVIKIDNPPAKEIFHFCTRILDQERVKYDNKTVLSIVKKCYPDIRKTIQALQENSMDGKLVGDAIHASESVWNDILDSIIRKDIDMVRKLLRSNYIDYPALYEFLYTNAGTFKEPGGAILTIGDHLVNDTNIAIKEINFMHMVVQMIWNKVV